MSPRIQELHEESNALLAEFKEITREQRKITGKTKPPLTPRQKVIRKTRRSAREEIAKLLGFR